MFKKNNLYIKLNKSKINNRIKNKKIQNTKQLNLRNTFDLRINVYLCLECCCDEINCWLCWSS